MAQVIARDADWRSGTAYVGSGFVALSVLLGGASAAGATANFSLQALAIILLAWLAASLQYDRRTSRLIAGGAGVVILVGVLELVPVPNWLWSHLPFRAIVTENLRLAGAPVGWMPLSLTPHRTVASLLSILPAAAMAAFVATDRRGAVYLPLAIVAVAAASVFLGIGQAAGGRASPLYIYEITNNGYAVGFFANKNHLATLTLASLPCLALLYAGDDGDRPPTRGAVRNILFGGLGAFLIAGTLITGSNAGLLLLLPVLVASVMIARNHRVKISFLLLTIGLVSTVLICAYLFWPAGAAMLRQATGEVSDRLEIWTQGVKILSASFPIGTGLGSFSTLCALFDDPSKVTGVFINHAHNDYLELIVELGVLGALLLLVFVSWWVVAAVRIWRSEERLPKVATLLSAIVLAHSLVDYPARTAAIMVIFAAALAIMARAADKTLITSPILEHSV
jgi:O-antigen ligase